MTGCVAFGCSNRSENGFIMKAFPRDPTRRALWEAKVRRKNWKATNTSFLCEMHFSADQWEKPRVDGSRKLKLNAIPNIFSFPSKKPRKAAAVRKQSIITSENYKVSEVTVSFEQNTSNSEQSLVLCEQSEVPIFVNTEVYYLKNCKKKDKIIKLENIISEKDKLISNLNRQLNNFRNKLIKIRVQKFRDRQISLKFKNTLAKCFNQDQLTCLS